MPDKAVHLLVVDGYADWEPAHAVAELRRHGRYRVETVALSTTAVTSMGGIRVLPTTTVENVDAAQVAAFIVPGGDRWETAPLEAPIAELLRTLEAQGVPIAAICAATTVIARLSLLKGRRHTSNGLRYLQSKVPATPKKRTTSTNPRFAIVASSPQAGWRTWSSRACCSRSSRCCGRANASSGRRCSERPGCRRRSRNDAGAIDESPSRTDAEGARNRLYRGRDTHRRRVRDLQAARCLIAMPDAPYEVYNLNDTEPVVAVLARSSADEWDRTIPYARPDTGDRTRNRG